MFEGWGEFYLLAGSAAAVLIGLIFVVVTLMQDRTRSSVLSGSKLYMGPIVLHVSFALVLSAAALAHGITAARIRFASPARSRSGASRAASSSPPASAPCAGEDKPHWTDIWFYGGDPGAALPAARRRRLGLLERAAHGRRTALAAVVTALLLISIRNEWDLVTWLAPKPDPEGPGEE